MRGTWPVYLCCAYPDNREAVNRLKAIALASQAENASSILVARSMHRDPVESILSGGNSSAVVSRVGNTTRRPTNPWSHSVDSLLLHFEDMGLDCVPRPLGYDDQKRQMLSFAEGYVSDDPSDLDIGRLVLIGLVIREPHDASESFVSPPDAVWNVLIAPDKEELICHNDLAPWNLVRSSTALTFIDWDGAGPSSRLADLAYAAHGFVPFAPEANMSDETAARRLAALISGYGLDTSDRARLAHMLGPRVRSMYELLRDCHEKGIKPWSRLWLEGHGEVWLAHATYVEERSEVWADALNI